MGTDTIGANANDFGSHFLEDAITVAEGTGFAGTAGGIVLGIKVKHNRFFTQEILQTDGGSCGGWECEIGGAIADFNRSCHR